MYIKNNWVWMTVLRKEVFVPILVNTSKILWAEERAGARGSLIRFIDGTYLTIVEELQAVATLCDKDIRKIPSPKNKQKGEKMPDKLNEMYEAWLKNTPDGDVFQAFQGGVTAGAVSLRQRAMKLVATGLERNELMNAIGQLSDIPQE